MPSKYAKGTPVRLPAYLYDACKEIAGEQTSRHQNIIYYVRQMALRGRKHLRDHAIPETISQCIASNRNYAPPRSMGFDSQLDAQLQGEARQRGFSYNRYISLLVAVGREQYDLQTRRHTRSIPDIVTAESTYHGNGTGLEVIHHPTLDDVSDDIMAVYTPLVDELDDLFHLLHAPLSTTQKGLRYVPIVWVTGASGCGKTTLATALATLRADVLYVDASRSASRTGAPRQLVSLDSIRQPAKYLIVDECHLEVGKDPQTLVDLIQAYREQRSSILLLSQTVSKPLFAALSNAGITIILSAFESRGQLPVMAHRRKTASA
jgi:hypothetical protein